MKKNEIEKRLSEYRESVKSMETERWVNEYAEDAEVEDPVGGPIHSGHEQLTTFFNNVRKGIKQLVIEPEVTIITPPEAAVKGTATALMKDGAKWSFPLISTYKFKEDGKIIKMRAYWDQKNWQKL